MLWLAVRARVAPRANGSRMVEDERRGIGRIDGRSISASGGAVTTRTYSSPIRVGVEQLKIMLGYRDLDRRVVE